MESVVHNSANRHPQTRLAYLDNARAWLMIFGVAFHAGMMFSPTNDYLVKFDTREALISKVVAVSGVFRMEVFFLLAALLGAGALGKYGREVFLEKRFVRLAPPFIAGLAALNLIAYPLVKDQPLVDSHWPVVQHLWFLPVLLTLAIIHQQFFHPERVSRWLSRVPNGNPWLVVPGVAVAFSVSIFYLEQLGAHLGSGRVIELTGGFLSGKDVVHFLPYYLLGVALYHYRSALDRLLKLWPLFIPMAGFNFSGLPILDDPTISTFARNLASLGIGGLILAFFRYLYPDSLARPWMSNFSFTLYLIHQPLLFLFRWPVMEMTHNSYLRFAIICAVVIAAAGLIHMVIARSHLLSFFFNGETKTNKPVPTTLATSSEYAR